MASKDKSPKKSSKKTKATIKPVASSAEYIVDSDLDAGSGSERIQPKTKPSTAHTNASKSNQGSKRKASSAEDSGVVKKKRIDASSPKLTVDLSQKEFKKVRHVNGHSSPPSTSSASLSNEPTSQTSATSQPTLTANGAIDSRYNLEASETSSEKDRSDQDHASESSLRTSTARRTEAQDARASPFATKSTEMPDYKPPAGFSIASLSNGLVPEIRDIISPANLEGKQLWHITAPASVPISKLKKCTVKALADGKTIVSHQGSDYAFSAETDRTVSSKLLIPAVKGNRYQPVAKPIHKTLHMRQVVELPISRESSSPSRSCAITGSNKPTLRQPIGLKMRYRPFGDVDSDKHIEQAAWQAKERIKNAQIPLPPVVSPSKKNPTKTKKVTEIDHTNTEWVDPGTYTAPVVVGNNSQHTVEMPSEALSESQTVQDVTETPEDKARRKAEKAARKEARMKRREARINEAT